MGGMDGLQDGTKVGEGAAQQPKPQDDQAQQAASQVTGASEGGGTAGAAGRSAAGYGAASGAGGAGGAGSAGGGDNAAKARADYEAALKVRDEKIAELEGEIAEAAKTVESAERLRAEMDELRRQGDEQRVSFELQLAGARNVKAAKALLSDYDNDIEKLRAADPWLFGGSSAAAQTGATGLPNAGAATDEGAQMRRWRDIAGLPEDKE